MLKTNVRSVPFPNFSFAILVSITIGKQQYIMSFNNLVNNDWSDLYCQLLGRIEEQKGIVFHHDNARPHTFLKTKIDIQ